MINRVQKPKAFCRMKDGRRQTEHQGRKMKGGAITPGMSMDRRVVRELSLLLVTLPPPNFAPPSSPFNSILERVVRCWHSNAYSSLFSSLFFFDFHRTNFSRFRRTFHSLDPVGVKGAKVVAV
jgi:hypothetical protein